jgi:hypothetical protein
LNPVFEHNCEYGDGEADDCAGVFPWNGLDAVVQDMFNPRKEEYDEYVCVALYERWAGEMEDIPSDEIADTREWAAEELMPEFSTKTC